MQTPHLLLHIKTALLRILVPSCLLFLMATHATAQVYPVTTLTQVSAPYPVSLDEFVSGAAAKVQLHITINDATLDAYPVKLRMKLASNTVSITTSAWMPIPRTTSK
jgi:hypothetical protein